MDRTRILLVDDHALLRETLKDLLNAQPDMHVVAEAGTGEFAVEQAAAIMADIILLDISLPDRSGISFLPELHRLCPSISCVVVLTMHDDPAYLRAALAAGAAGYVVKSSPAAVLLEAIRSVKGGAIYVDPSMRQYLTKSEKLVQAAAPVPIERLSDRERQVLGHLAQGLRYKTIAEKMHISVKTVETYRTRLRVKLGFKNREDLMRFAIESGILDNPPA